MVLVTRSSTGVGAWQKAIFARPRATPRASCSCNLQAQVSKGKLRIRIDSSRDSPAGAEAAYLLRRLAARAGAYAPGIQEYLFYEIAQNANGSTLDKVEHWLHIQSGKLANLGYQILAKRTAYPSAEIVDWVDKGLGYRAAVLAVDGRKLYEDSSGPSSHAVALMRHDETSGIGEDMEHGVVMIDAMPGKTRFQPVPKTLARAHFVYKYQTILMFWTGYS